MSEPEAPEPETPEPVAEPEAAGPEAGKVLARDKYGRAYLIDADKAPLAEQRGLKLETPEERQEREERKVYGEGAENAAKTFGAAAARTATFGLSDEALVHTGVSTPELLKKRTKYNPGFDTAGTIVGAVAPALVGDEAGLLSAANPIKAVSALGRGVEGAIAGEGAGLLRAAGAKAIGTALEGAAYGAGNVVSEDALGDPNLTAESALAHVGMSAALMGGLGGLGGVAESALPKAIEKGKDAVEAIYGKGKDALENFYKGAEGLTGTPSELASAMVKHGERITELEHAAPGIAEDISHATPEMGQWLIENSPKLHEMETAFPGTTRQLARTSPDTAKYLLDNWDKIITDPQQRVAIAEKLSGGMGDVVSSTNDLMRRLNKELAPAEADALLAHANPEATSQAYGKVFDDLGSVAQKMRAEPELYGQSYARQLEELQKGWLRDADASVDPAEAFRRFRTLRQSLDEAIPYTKDMGALGLSERNSLKLLKDLRAQVKGALTDEGVFGPAAARQASLDSAQSEWLSLMKRGGDFNTKFMKKVVGKGGVSYELKPTKVNTWLNQMADARGADAAETWGRVIEAARTLHNEAEASFKAAPVGQFDREGLNSILKKAEDSTVDAKTRASVTQLKNQLDPKMSWGSNAVAPHGGHSIVETAIHMVVPHSITEAFAKAAGAINVAKSVPRGVAMLAALESSGRSISKKIDTGVAAVLAGAKHAGPLARGALSAEIAKLGGGHEEAKKHFKKRVAEVQELANNPTMLQQKLEAQTAHFHEHAPNVSGAAQMATVRAVQFLQSKVPQHPQAGPLAKEWTPTQHEVWKFNRYHAAVDAPLEVLRHAAAGTVTPEDIEAVKTVYPQLYQKMTTALLSKVAEHKGAVPYKSRLSMSLMLGTPLDGTTSQAAIAANQAAYARPSAKSGQDQTGPAALGKTTQQGLSKLSVGSRAALPGQAAGMRRGEA